MKTLKDKLRYNLVEMKDFISLTEEAFKRDVEKDLKQAIKDLKEELKNKQVNKRRTNNQIIDKIFGVWEEKEVMGE